MKKFWLVFRYEYLRHVLRRRFIFALLSVPFFLLLTVGISLLAVYMQTDRRPAGVVDLSGALANARPVPGKGDALIPDTTFTAFNSPQQAEAALSEGTIQGFFVLSEDYLQSGSVQYFTVQSIKEATQSDFADFLRYNLAARLPEQVSERVVEGPNVVVRSLDGSRSSDENDFMSILLPVFIGIIFLLVINVSGSYLVQALVEEKENRTMEIMVTSVSSDQLMAGKVVGNLGVGLTQLAIWLLVGVVGLWVARVNFDFALKIDWQLVVISALTLLPAFVMVAALMATAGATTTDNREAQQVAGYFTLPVVLPYMLMANIMETPNSPISVGMSLFPLTAPIALPMRAAFTNIPTWQVVLSITLVFAGAFGAVWLAARAFRMGMLRYGKRLSWKEILSRGEVR